MYRWYCYQFSPYDIAEVIETKCLCVIQITHRNDLPISCTPEDRVQKVLVSCWCQECLSDDTMLSIYQTCIYHYIRYCIHVQGKAYNIHLGNLIVLKIKIIHIINGGPPRTNVNKYVIMGVLHVKRVYNYAIESFMGKYVSNMLPVSFVNCLSNVTDLHQYNTGHVNWNSIHGTFHSYTRDSSPLATVVLLSGTVFLLT